MATAGCALQDAEGDTRGAEQELIIIDVDKFHALKPGELIQVNLTNGDVYQINLPSRDELNLVRVISDEGDYIMSEHVKFRAEDNLPTGMTVPLETADYGTSSPDNCVCIEVCCWHIKCYCGIQEK